MHTAEQVTRSPHRSTDLPPPSGPWHRLLGRRTLALIGAAFLLRLIATVLSLTGAGPVALANWVAIAFCLGMLVVLAVNLVRARRELVPTWWGAYRARGEDEAAARAGLPTRDDSRSNVVDLSAHRRGRRSGRVAALRDDTGQVQMDGPQRTAAVVGALLVVASLIGVTVWQLVGGGNAGPVEATPAVSVPAAAAPGAAVSVPASPKATRPARPSAATPSPTGAAPLAAVVPSVDPPSAGPAGDGTYLIGVDLEAGTWRAGAVLTVPLGQCVYKVNAGSPKSPLLTVGAVTVALTPGDVFTTAGCPPWRLT